MDLLFKCWFPLTGSVGLGLPGDKVISKTSGMTANAGSIKKHFQTSGTVGGRVGGSWIDTNDPIE